MLKNALMAATLLPFLVAPAMAQDRASEHHYQGGPKAQHHIGKRDTGTTAQGQGTPSQAGQHHYQGGPKEIHHIGPMPGQKAKHKKQPS
jgi:hypothetical protein